MPLHAHFIWRVIRGGGRITVREKLSQREVQCPIFCPCCSLVAEIVDHALGECLWCKQVWFESVMGFVWEGDHVLSIPA